MSLLFSESKDKGATERKVSWLMQLRGWLIGHLRQAVASLGEIWRDPIPSLMTIAVLGVSLTLPATLYVVVKNAELVEDNWDSASEISLFFKAEISERDTQNLVNRIALMPEIESVNFVSKKQALAEFENLSGFGDALKYLDDNPLPDVLMVVPQKAFTSPLAASELLERLEKLSGIDYGKLDIEWLRRLEAVVGLIKDALLSLAFLLVVSVVLIVGNTIRLSILSRKEEIEVLKLVGATDFFIHRPFLFTGIWYGFFGGVIAWLAIEIMLLWIKSAIDRLAELYQSGFELQSLGGFEMLNLLLISMSLGLMGSLIVVWRQIRHIEPDAS